MAEGNNRSVQDKISGFWTAVAAQYETHPGNTVPVGSAAYDRWVELFQRVLPSLPASVLDVGTGTGFAALICASLGHRVVGIDLAPAMLRVAHEMAAERGVDVHFMEGDAVMPPFEAEEFDVVVSRHLLWTLRDAEHAVRNWHRVLRPGGRVVAVDSLRPRCAPAAEQDPDDIFGRHYSPEVQAAIPFMHVVDEGPLIDVLARAGFDDVTVERLPKDFAEENEPDVQPYVVVATKPDAAVR